MKNCANETCSRSAARKFCSRDCQLAARNQGHYGRHRRQLPDVWVDMDLYWAIVERAELLDVTVRDVILSAIEIDVGYPIEEPSS